MKKDLHPKYFLSATVTCVNCGSAYPVGSDKEVFQVEICKDCHPFYSGKEVVLDTAGRVDKFKKRAAAAKKA
jgi:large subunit ribosomal protein L31